MNSIKATVKKYSKIIDKCVYTHVIVIVIVARVLSTLRLINFQFKRIFIFIQLIFHGLNYIKVKLLKPRKYIKFLKNDFNKNAQELMYLDKKRDN
jgi:hypothetical protein